MKVNHKAWDIGDAVQFYEEGRNTFAHLYDSEQLFFRHAVKNSQSILDVGCAAGGTYNIIRELNKTARYTGVDVSIEMVKAAQKLFPSVDFRQTDGEKLPFKDGEFECVIALGVLNHVPDYRSLMREMCRVSNRYCVFDLTRLLPTDFTFDANKSYMTLSSRFGDNDNTETRVPYVVTDAAEMFDFIVKDLKPGLTIAKGYFGQFSPSITAPVDEVCFTVVLFDKQSPEALVVDLPRAIRERLAKKEISFTEAIEEVMCNE